MHVVICVIIYFYGNQNSKDSDIRQQSREKNTTSLQKETTKSQNRGV